MENVGFHKNFLSVFFLFFNFIDLFLCFYCFLFFSHFEALLKNDTFNKYFSIFFPFFFNLFVLFLLLEKYNILLFWLSLMNSFKLFIVFSLLLSN